MSESTVLRFVVPDAVAVPRGATPVLFAYQPERGAWSVWMLVKDPDVPHDWRRFDVVPTGVSFTGRHIASAIMPDDFHVFHLIEVVDLSRRG